MTIFLYISPDFTPLVKLNNVKLSTNSGTLLRVIRNMTNNSFQLPSQILTLNFNYIHLHPQIVDFAFGNMAWFTIRVTMGDKYDKVLNMNSLKQRLSYEDTNMYISKEPMFQKNLLSLSSGFEYGGSRLSKSRFISTICCMLTKG